MAQPQLMSFITIHPGSSSSIERDFLILCHQTVRSIQALVKGGNVMNERQCRYLSLKLFKTVRNVEELFVHCGGSTDLFTPAMENLYRIFETARLLVAKCCKEDWVTEAIFQIENGKDFQVILLEVGLCYHTIYEQAKEISEISDAWEFQLCEDLRKSSVFSSAPISEVRDDQDALKRKLEGLVSSEQNSPQRSSQYLQQCLARYLLVSWESILQQSQTDELALSSVILCMKEIESRTQTWGKYAYIGSGSSSGVVRTEWLGIQCAKKVFGRVSESLLLKEAGILFHLNHPNVVKFFCCGFEEGTGDSYIAMERMEMSLAKLILYHAKKGTPFLYPEVIEIIMQIARGMSYLHDVGVAHRDLKPQNVVVNKLKSPQLDDYYTVKLVDFGMSKMKSSESDIMTRPAIGTTFYRAPELHSRAPGRKVTWFKADVYSFGVTCAHLLSLKEPFENVNLGILYSELMNGLRPELPATCPEKLVALINNCWATDPRLRPSFTKICIQLEEVRHELLRGLPSRNQGFKQEVRIASTNYDFVETEGTRDIDYLTNNGHRELSAPVVSRADFPHKHRRNFYENQCRVLKEQLSIAEEILNKRTSPSDVSSADLFRPQMAILELCRVVKKGKILIEGCQDELCQKAYLRLAERTVAFVQTLKEISCMINLFSTAGVVMAEQNLLEGAALADQKELQASVNNWIESHNTSCSAEECGRPLSEHSFLCLANQIRARVLNDKGDITADDNVDHKSVLWKTTQGALEDVRELGKGSYGTVFETKWVGDTYAKKEFETIPEESEREFEKEVNALANLNHPNIVKVQAYSVGSGTCFFLMEKMPCDLKAYMRGRMKLGIYPPFSILASIDLALQISEAMGHVNSQGMVHRDLKAANILVKAVNDSELCKEGFVIAKLADFGLAKRKPEITSHLTRENLGTTLWRAPEMFKVAEALDAKSFPRQADVYSFGIVCSEILTGMLPFHHVSIVPSQFYKQITDPDNPLRPKLPESCPESLASLICKCWHTDPKRRPTFNEISSRLRVLKGRIWLTEGGGTNKEEPVCRYRGLRVAPGAPGCGHYVRATLPCDPSAQHPRQLPTNLPIICLIFLFFIYLFSLIPVTT